MKKSASYYLAYTLRKLWTLFAVVLVFVAASLSILRFSLPYLDEQKHQLEDWLSAQYGVDLEIGKVTAGWSGIGPSLVLQDIHLKQSEQSPIDLNVSETRVELDFWGSLVARQIQATRFELEGLILTVDVGQIQQSQSDYPIVEALESLFLEQLQRFSVSDSQVEVRTPRDQQLIQIEQLSWVNKEQRHQGVGQLRVVELASNSAYFALDLFGDKDDLHGTFYARAEELDVSPWLNELVKTENQLTQSRANFKFWAGIEGSRIYSVQVALGGSEFAWETPETDVRASILGGDLVAVPQENGWKLNLDNLAMQSGGSSLISSWYGQVDYQGNGVFQSRIPMELDALVPVLPILLDNQSTSLIGAMDPGVRVDDLFLRTGAEPALHMKFSQMGWQQVGMLPGLQNLTGEFNLLHDKGQLSLSGIAGRLEIDNILPTNVMYRNFNLEAFTTVEDGQLQLTVPQIEFESDLVTLEGAVAYQGGNNHLTISSQIEPMEMQQIKQLFPTELMGVETRAYLVKALQTGSLKHAGLLWDGPIDAFPFSQNQGVFQATVNLSDVTFVFDDAWPGVEEMDIDLLFENEALYMAANKGRMMDTSLMQLQAVIPALKKGAVLDIAARAEATGQQAAELMLASSLADSVGSALSTGVQISDKMSATLDLHIPLTGEDVVAKGTVVLDNASVFIPSIQMQLSQATGEVHFINDRVDVSQLQANLLGQPVAVSFTGALTDKGAYSAKIDVGGSWQVQPLLNTYHPGLNEYLLGGSDWQAVVELLLEEDDYSYTLQLDSSLEGVSSTLPTPFYKATDAPMLLSVSSEGNGQATTVKATLGDQVRFDGILPHNSMQFSRAHLALGGSDLVSMGLGFSISADLPLLDFAAWFKAIDVLLDDIPQGGTPLLEEPKRVYVNADAMLIAGQKIDQLELVAKHSTEDWLLEFKADQAIASVMFYDDWDNKGIEVNADFINLAKWEGETQRNHPTQLDLPPIAFECKQCKIHGKDLGHVDFRLVKQAGGMRIDSVRMNNANGIFYATGDWMMDGQNSSTVLNGEFSSPDFGAFLKGLGLDSGIKDSKAKVAFDLNWQDAPFNFDIATLNGNLDWGLTDGYLTEVSDKGVRVFSFLSLQSLVRKLSLDFRDVFAKGFFYDKMNGSFVVTDGRAFTEDTVIDGGAGEMTIAGTTDLNNQQLDLEIGFTPNLTSSLPLLVYWLSNTNPATAIAALAIDQVLTEAKVISNVRYSVTGTIDDPVMTELNRKSKNITLPAKTDQDGSGAPVESGQAKPDIPVLNERVTVEVSNG